MKKNMAFELKVQLNPLEKAKFSAKFLKISDTNSCPGKKNPETNKKVTLQNNTVMSGIYQAYVIATR